MINLLKKYLYISLGIHVFIVIAGLIISSGNNIKQPFVVLGAHSKKEYHTLYKARNSIIPFMGHGSAGAKKSKYGNGDGKSGSGKKRSGKSANSSSSKNKKLKKSAKNSKISEKSQGNLGEKKSKASSKKKQLTEPLEKSKKQKRKELEEVKKIEEELKKIELEAQKEMDQEIEEEKKREAEKREAEKKKELEKEVEKKEQEDAQVKAAKQASEETEDSGAEQDDQDSQDDQVGEATDGGVQEEFIFTLGNMDGSQAAYSRHIQSETGRLWKPPLGVPKGTTCKVKFIIGKDGNVEDFQTIQKSSIIIYDLSILKVAHLFKFDKCLWGKSFVIDFRQ